VRLLFSRYNLAASLSTSGLGTTGNWLGSTASGFSAATGRLCSTASGFSAATGRLCTANGLRLRTRTTSWLGSDRRLALATGRCFVKFVYVVAGEVEVFATLFAFIFTEAIVFFTEAVIVAQTIVFFTEAVIVVDGIAGIEVVVIKAIVGNWSRTTATGDWSLVINEVIVVNRIGVGAGSAAMEASCKLAKLSGETVTLSMGLKQVFERGNNASVDVTEQSQNFLRHSNSKVFYSSVGYPMICTRAAIRVGSIPGTG